MNEIEELDTVAIIAYIDADAAFDEAHRVLINACYACDVSYYDAAAADGTCEDPYEAHDAACDARDVANTAYCDAMANLDIARTRMFAAERAINDYLDDYLDNEEDK